eukprot:GFKZ01003448.1.p3 GENE.GFKZ01003448.1~~GFKZ01003448.1.p3  ORF type:complete len:103 (+),score=5.20 GFKZ01003448.1:158-466(+)
MEADSNGGRKLVATVIHVFGLHRNPYSCLGKSVSRRMRRNVSSAVTTFDVASRTHSPCGFCLCILHEYTRCEKRPTNVRNARPTEFIILQVPYHSPRQDTFL